VAVFVRMRIRQTPWGDGRHRHRRGSHVAGALGGAVAESVPHHPINMRILGVAGGRSDRLCRLPA
jgi:hypothetical protein